LTKLVDYHEVLDNLQDETKHLLLLEKFMQIRTNPKVQSDPKGLCFYEVTHCSLATNYNININHKSMNRLNVQNITRQSIYADFITNSPLTIMLIFVKP